ncbi:MAG: Chaperone protein DnaJ [Acidimicrobiales bacterium]|nr:MAG: hypothetical protein EDR02_12310 [Actinomycetota bacterium]MBV6510262.1 Chaperone protein DnaJ [Acidimicrobiales bacterium]RIK04224.1 MAG: hypothetical protein DCC48_14125 [Acidobacteriota bacterium]
MAPLKLSPSRAELPDVHPERADDAADGTPKAERVEVSFVDTGFAEPECFFPRSSAAASQAGQFEHYFPIETLFASYDQQQQEQVQERQRPTDPFEVLGLSREATVEQIRAAHKKLVKRYHPDRYQNRGIEARQRAERRMSLVNAAYSEVLSLQERRPATSSGVSEAP